MTYQFDTEKMQFMKKRKFPIFRYVALVLLLGILLSPIWAFQKKYNEPKERVLYVTIPKTEFSPENLRDYIEELNISFPHIVYAQAVQETGEFTSTIFKENHNLFGMKVARSRATTAKGTRRGHAYYDNWMESVIDYALYQNRYLYDVRKEEDYLDRLDGSYAEDSLYVYRLKYISNRDDLATLFQY